MLRTEYRDEKFAFPFVAYTPEKEQNGKLPLIIQLHGAGERGNGQEDLKLVDVHGFSKLFAKEDFDCITVMPQCPNDTFWAGRVESILRFVEQMKQEFDVDADRIYLTGISMGGFGTWYTAMAKPEIFAAIAPVCGGGMPWNAAVLTMPIWAIHGSADTVVKPSYSEDMIEKVQTYNEDVTYTLVEGVGHNVWDYTYDAKLMNWLLSKKK
ncbi:MAG: prolyl oligopeptidase family serine peptidase [Clostridia bacterium]|nr:prolyl oligopeptidase family serine peptidase [Clostridia bacterium]